MRKLSKKREEQVIRVCVIDVAKQLACGQSSNGQLGEDVKILARRYLAEEKLEEAKKELEGMS